MIPHDATEHDDDTGGRADRIVVGFDGSRFAWKALRWAADEAGCRRADLEVVQCVTAAPTPMATDSRAPGGPPVGSDRAQVEEAVRVARSRGGQVCVTPSVTTASPGNALVDRSRGAVLLVLGRHDPDSATSAVGESLSEYSIAHAECPVMVIAGVHGQVPSAPASPIQTVPAGSAAERLGDLLG